jgi:hypothetical protein
MSRADCIQLTQVDVLVSRAGYPVTGFFLMLGQNLADTFRGGGCDALTYLSWREAPPLSRASGLNALVASRESRVQTLWQGHSRGDQRGHGGGFLGKGPFRYSLLAKLYQDGARITYKLSLFQYIVIHQSGYWRRWVLCYFEEGV